MPVERPTLNEPWEWNFDRPRDLDRRGNYHGYRQVERMSIEFEEPILTDLPDNSVEAIEQVVNARGLYSRYLETVRKLDDQHVELVYWGDDETEVDQTVIENVQREIQGLFGPLWQVERKRDERRGRAYGDDIPRYRNKQRLIVFRMVGRRFKYEDEEEGEYRLMVEDRPEGIDESAQYWRETDVIPAHPIMNKADIGYYESSTGTQHLVDVRSLRNSYVVEGTTTECGTPVTPEEIADGAITHHLDVLKEFIEEEVALGSETPAEAIPHTEAHTPEAMHGDDLCSSCRRSWGDVRTDDNGLTESVDAPITNWTDVAREAWDDD
jgi:hypothetical protein